METVQAVGSAAQLGLTVEYDNGFYYVGSQKPMIVNQLTTVQDSTDPTKNVQGVPLFWEVNGANTGFYCTDIGKAAYPTFWKNSASQPVVGTTEFDNPKPTSGLAPNIFINNFAINENAIQPYLSANTLEAFLAEVKFNLLFPSETPRSVNN